MRKKFCLIWAFYIVCTQASFSETNESGIIIFGNFEYFKYNNKEFKETKINYSGENFTLQDGIKLQTFPNILLPNINNPDINPENPTVPIIPIIPIIPENNGKPLEPIKPNPIKPIIPGEPSITEPSYIFFNNKWLVGQERISEGNLEINGINNGVDGKPLYNGMGSIKENYIIINTNNQEVTGDSGNVSHIGMLSINGGGIINGETGSIVISGNNPNNNIGMLIKDFGVATNEGKILINNGQIGMYSNPGSTIINTGNIETSTTGGTGMYVNGNGSAINKSNINLSSSENGNISVGIQGINNANLSNEGNIIMNGPLSVGMAANIGTTAINTGNITANSSGQYGMYGYDKAILKNNNTINVFNGAIGAYVDNSTNFENLNNGNINVNAGIGVYLAKDATTTNNGNIIVENNGIGIWADNNSIGTNKYNINTETNSNGMEATNGSSVINATGASINLNGLNSTGLLAEDTSSATNSGYISINQSTQTGIAGVDKATITNEGTINAENGVGLYMQGTGLAINSGSTIITNNSTGISINGEGIGKNTGYIQVGSDSTGMISTNDATIDNRGNISLQETNSTGMIASDNGKATNYGIINALKTQISMYGKDDAVLNNSGTLSVSGGTGMYISDDKGIANNASGVINVSNSGTGIYIAKTGTAVNSSALNIENGSIGINIIDGGTATNSGAITIKDNENQSVGIKISNSGTGTNTGVINIENKQVGMYGVGDVILASSGLIKTDSGIGIYVLGRGTGNNLGELDVLGTGTGICINGEGSGSNSGNINVVNTGIAMQSVNGGILTNTGKITMESLVGITSGGVAMFVDESGKATNTGIIEVGSGQVGMYSKNGAGIINTGTIDANGGIGMFVNGDFNCSNDGEILVESNGIGITSNGNGTIINNSAIDITKTGTGMLSTNGTTLINNGSINLGVVKPTIKPLVDEVIPKESITSATNTAIGMSVDGLAKATNKGTITTLTNQIGMYGTNGSILENKGTILTNGGIGMQLSGAGTITNIGSLITVTNLGTGVYVNGVGNAENTSTISITEGSIGMKVENGGTIINSGTINIQNNSSINSITDLNKGMSALSNGIIENNGIININSENSIGIYIVGENVNAKNSSKIDVNASNSVAMVSSGKNTLINNKYIFLEDGLEEVYAFSVNGGSVQNTGTVSLGTTGQMYTGTGEFFNVGNISASESELLKLSNDTNFIMENGGTISKLDGTSSRLLNATLGFTYMPNLFVKEDTQYKAIQLSFEANKLYSYSNMYDITEINNEIYIRRKNFTEISETMLGNYLEKLYLDEDNLYKDELYLALRSARTQNQFNQHLDSFFGRDFYPMIVFQTKDAINFTTNNILDNLETRYNKAKENSYIIGYSLERFKKSGFDRTVGYDEYLNSFYLGKQYTYNNQSDYGFIFSYTRLDSEYKKDTGKRDSNFFQGTTFMNYSKEEIKGIGTLYIGYGYGDIKRNMNVEYLKLENDEISYWEIKENYHSNLKNFYLGTSGKISKEYSYNSYFIEPEIKLNIMGVFQGEINESGDKYALELEKLNRVFSNTKVGISLGKVYYPKDNYKLTLKLKGALSQDINSSNNYLRLKLKNISNEKAKIEVEKRNEFSQEVGARIELQKNLREELTFYIDYKYMFEEKNSWKIATGFVYAF